MWIKWNGRKIWSQQIQKAINAVEDVEKMGLFFTAVRDIN